MQAPSHFALNTVMPVTAIRATISESCLLLPQIQTDAANRALQSVKTRVFLSYSRADSGFTDRLAEALAESGYTPDYDRSVYDPNNIDSGISAQDQWWRRLQQMIAKADVVVFIVSPDSAGSKVCDEEIAYAQGLGKRIIPILRRPIDFAKAPPRLSAHNVKIDFTDDAEASFESALKLLRAPLDVDVVWYHESRRLTQLALEWDWENRPSDRLMSSADIRAMARLLESRPRNADLPPQVLIDFRDESRMDRPALQELRRDLKADVFDVIYFLAADRIARAVIYQTIIIGEMLLYKKDIVINGQQYIDKSENKFTMTVLGAVAELERAKITERMTRGKLHRLRQGVMASGGVAPFGYRYTQASPDAPRMLAPQEPEAGVVRWMFETYAAGATLRSLAKSLEQRGVRTRFGKELWAYAQIRDMMQNPTYAGMRYFNRRTEVKDDPQRKRGRTILRDRSEWIGIAVPPLVSAELFDRVQERLAENLQRYVQPAAHYALSGLVECGECGSAFCSYRRATSPRSWSRA